MFIKPTNKAPRGFTLIELLVVIAIIALLISILLPIVSKAKQAAMTVKCAANLRAQGQALMLYTQQTGYYPACYFNNNWKDPYVFIWPTRLRNMLKGNQDVFYCPASDPRCRWNIASKGPVLLAKDIHFGFGYRVGERLLIDGIWFSYGYNLWGPGQNTPTFGNPPYGRLSFRGLGFRVNSAHDSDAGQPRATWVKTPSEMIAIADSVSDGIADFEVCGQNTLLNPPGRLHNGGANVLFCDGHVQLYRQEELLFDPNPVKFMQMSGRDLQIRLMWTIDHTP